MVLLATGRSGSFNGIFSLAELLQKNVYLFFLAFNDNLFAINYYLIFDS